MHVIRCAALALAVTLSSAALAQQPAPADPATLAAARDLVSKMQGDRNAVLQSMAAPMVGMVAQMGVSQADRAQVLVGEVIIPTLASRYDELLDIQAKAFAATLPTSDLQAAAAFYGSPAGRNFAAAQPKLAQASIAGMTQWMGSVAPEMQTKLQAAVQKHGWGPAGRK